MSTLADLTYATSRQINSAIDLGSDRNARRILYELECDKLITSTMRDRKVYYITQKGGDFIARDNPKLLRSQIDHSIMRNSLQKLLGYPSDWKAEVPIKIDGEVVLTSDAVYTKGGRIYFVEVDNRTSMQSNNAKIKRYANITKSLGRPATLVWYTLVESRKDKLRENTEKAGIDCRIY